MARKSSQQDLSKTERGRRSSQDEQQRALSTQEPAEGRRDVGQAPADTDTGSGSRGHAPQGTDLSTDKPAEGDRESVDE